MPSFLLGHLYYPDPGTSEGPIFSLLQWTTVTDTCSLPVLVKTFSKLILQMYRARLMQTQTRKETVEASRHNVVLGHMGWNGVLHWMVLAGEDGENSLFQKIHASCIGTALPDRADYAEPEENAHPGWDTLFCPQPSWNCSSLFYNLTQHWQQRDNQEDNVFI